MAGRPVDHREQMLADALARARKLVADLEQQQAEIQDNSAKLTPSQLAQGRHAFEMALASARQALKALEDAAAVIRDKPL